MSDTKMNERKTPPTKRKQITVTLHQEYDGTWTTSIGTGLKFPSTSAEQELWSRLQAALKQVRELKAAAMGMEVQRDH
jgi:hypothetical protein